MCLEWLPGSDWQWDLLRKISKTWESLIWRSCYGLGERGNALLLMHPVFRVVYSSLFAGNFGCWRPLASSLPENYPRMQGIAYPQVCTSPQGVELDPWLVGVGIKAGSHLLQFGRTLIGHSSPRASHQVGWTYVATTWQGLECWSVSRLAWI